jgi:uncharacterized protein (TIGR02246 family)
LTKGQKGILIGNMKLRIALTLCLLAFALAQQAPGAETRTEQSLRDLDARWSAAASAKDVDKTVSFYAEDATVMPPNGASAVNKEAIRTIWKDLLTSPGLAISWKTTKVQVARSGELAVLIGTYELTMNDSQGRPAPDHGKYLAVWKKQAEGNWKCAMDIWNSDLPANPPAEKK